MKSDVLCRLSSNKYSWQRWDSHLHQWQVHCWGESTVHTVCRHHMHLVALDSRQFQCRHVCNVLLLQWQNYTKADSHLLHLPLLSQTQPKLLCLAAKQEESNATIFTAACKDCATCQVSATTWLGLTSECVCTAGHSSS